MEGRGATGGATGGAMGGLQAGRFALSGGMEQDRRLTELEEMVAHLSRTVEELSDVLARQDGELALMAHRLQTLMERAAEQELAAGTTAPLADQKPPHW